MIVALFALGLTLLVAGGDLLVRGAARLASLARVSPLVIGLTVVAFGTSAPELAVTVAAVGRGEPHLALGNVVGSNITNLLLIMGMAAVVTPLAVSRRVVRLDVPILITASVVVVLLALSGTIGRVQGALLLGAGIAYTVVMIKLARRTDEPSTTLSLGPTPRRRRIVTDVAITAAGLALLVAGSRWLVMAATAMAEALGISQLAIGLTIVAIGTSLPELATTIVAGVRNQADMAVGNILGSNLFNLLLVLGAGAAVSPVGIGVPATAMAFDLPVMLAVTVATLFILYTGHCLSRWEGALFLAYFAGYMTYVLLIATGHGPLPVFRHALLVFALPLSVISLIVAAVRIRRGARP